MELKPFYPIHSFESGSYKESLLNKMIETLQKEGCEKAAACPEGESIDQWVAIHMAYFFNDISLHYGSIQEKCTVASCPAMAAGLKFEYLLVDKHKHKSPSRVPAKTYMDNLFAWTSRMLQDQTFFPPDKNSTFPPNAVDRVKNMSKRFFRVYAHIYYSHLEALQQLNLDKLFFDSLTYYLVFIDMYSLVPSSDLRPLSSLIITLVPNLRISQQLKEDEEMMKRLEEGNGQNKPVDGLNGLAVINDETEKLDWNVILQQAPECGAPASQEGETEGDENCICSIM